MPRKAKITAVPVEQPEASVADDEVKTDAQEMTEIINEVKEPEPTIEASVPEPKPKAKARRESPKNQSNNL